MREGQKGKALRPLSGNITFPVRLLKHAKLGCSLIVSPSVVFEEQKDQSTVSEDIWLSKACADMWHTWNKVAVTCSSSFLGCRGISVCNSALGVFSSLDRGLGHPCLCTHTLQYK